MYEPEGMEVTRIPRPSESIEQDSHKLTENEAASAGPTWVCTGSSACIL